VELGLFRGRARDGDLYVVGAFEDEDPQLGGAPAPVVRAADRWRSSTAPSGRRPFDAGSVDGVGVVCRDLGPRDCLDTRKVSRFVREAVETAADRRSERLILVLPDHEQFGPGAGREHVLVSAASAAYRYGDYLTARDEARLRWIGVTAEAASRDGWRADLTGARAVATGVRIARDLANTPPNLATPSWLAAEIRRLAERHGGQVQVLAERELERRGMGGILAVGSGSASPPRLVRWRRGNRGPKVALVGKGVTFDTGGISIKPAASMHEMKFDKCGACAVVGAMVAAAELRVEARIEAYLPFAENMPDAAAYRPGDIVRCYDGTTVEITNTDAEGRMILADALAWAAEGEPDHLVELSTLTGATVVALGTIGAALYTPDDGLAGALLQASGQSRDRLWRMPLWPEFLEEMKGNHADLKNSGERAGGANAAAGFLGHFAGDLRSWAHLDIAGTAYSSKPVSRAQAGATGFGVALLARWLREVSSAPPPRARGRKAQGRKPARRVARGKRSRGARTT
jgi:leucyl aminopeptidase